MKLAQPQLKSGKTHLNLPHTQLEVLHTPSKFQTAPS
jgi:hypothetical protein